ncbi:hypothetical protein TRFO_22963 [Tritrichomonas foetus]|uniref:Uncharacterized protein n=1 Tax=Tritrichomonas foetus TaxID=1144522 RepID=A0A1J4KC72_9EUKA|nr:hypothetical protein TRFO_22963 [Tritrichomonas foetus]|eukprot:OHT08528.1 hypothetical protein TRFO_22963 [Tritrichomonas foetus]
MSYFQAIDNMKVSFEQHQGDAKAELIVKNNMSKSELSNILIINGFPSASFRYVSGKKVLSGETPLINIKDGDKIRVIVSQSKKQIQRNEPHHTPTPSIQPLPNITHENLTSINQQYNQLENQSFFQNDSNIGESKPKLNSISLNHLIDVVIDSLPLHEIYENKKDFINHPKEVYQLGSAINDNKALFGAVYEYLRSQFRAHHQFDPIDE